jgi:site-specific recombinase XerD
VDLAGISPEILDAWVVSLRRQVERYADHGRRPAQSGGLAEVTISGRIQAVKSFLAWCVERGHLERSPARHLKRPQVRQEVGSKVMRAGDLERMLEEAERRAEAGQPRDLALLCFVADTGCRRGEVATLTLASLDLERFEALVSGKTVEHLVDFGNRTAAALRAWLEVRPDVEHDVVFVSVTTGEPLGVGGIYQVFKRLAAAAGVKGRFNPHALRHLVGQHFTDETNLELARQKLGHADIRTTAMFYANQDRERIKAASRKWSLVNHLEDDD